MSNTSRFCFTALHKSHANPFRIVSILVYVLSKKIHNALNLNIEWKFSYHILKTQVRLKS